ncbi:50S ribosomal protein L10, chloroplastic-like [Dioscorea cayenensis subsp. rotundata]|uniref:Large ribosomal subunit protein uL10c n=1 Tax=Dioscorea cayennensis subsp. rotundata TaxID=55577 RepID=A0AB40C9Y2_DIOCR|nr:50S ribosomal protein L10, chloroplastic-like [Dioscorea cayenensis subsp. rotundata]
MASSAVPSIRAAIRRTRAEAVRRQLEGCHLVAGIWYNGLTVRQLQDLRGALPPTARLLVAKNTVLANVLANTPWSKLNPCMRGANAWLFVHTDEIPGALKACRDFQRRTGLLLNDFVGAVFEGEVYGPEEFQALETMPTKEEVYSYLLGCLRVPAINLLSTLQAEDMGLLPSSTGEEATQS